jgi:hypothetical protein
MKPLHIFLIEGASIKKFMFMCIIQKMLLHYNKKFTNVNTLKAKIMNFYFFKSNFNIDRIIIHFALAIILNKNFNNLKSLTNEKCET